MTDTTTTEIRSARGETLQEWQERHERERDERLRLRLQTLGVPQSEVADLFRTCPEHRHAALVAVAQRIEARDRARTRHAHPATLRGRLRSELHAVADPPAAGVAARIKGIASAYDVLIDTVPTRTRIKPGAFALSLSDPAQRRRLRLLYQHDTTQVLGRITYVEEKPEGLHFSAEVADTALGRDVAALVKSGALREVSIGFDSEEHEFVEHRRGASRETVREVRRARSSGRSAPSPGARTPRRGSPRRTAAARPIPRRRSSTPRRPGSARSSWRWPRIRCATRSYRRSRRSRTASPARSASIPRPRCPRPTRPACSEWRWRSTSASSASGRRGGGRATSMRRSTGRAGSGGAGVRLRTPAG
jgi:HK97 family phage prohead protease